MTKDEFTTPSRVRCKFINKENLNKAQIVFEGLIETNPKSSDARVPFGAVLEKKQEDGEALKHLNKAIQLNNRQGSAYINRAEVYLRQNKVKEAVAFKTSN